MRFYILSECKIYSFSTCLGVRSVAYCLWVKYLLGKIPNDPGIEGFALDRYKTPKLKTHMPN